MHERQSAQRKGPGDGGIVAIPCPSLALLFPLAEGEKKNQEGGMPSCLPARAPGSETRGLRLSRMEVVATA